MSKMKKPLESLDIEQTRGIVVRKVNDAKQKYINKYHGVPNFVKLPVRVYDRLRFSNLIYTEVCLDYQPEMLMGLRVCPTFSIEDIDEIEVF